MKSRRKGNSKKKPQTMFRILQKSKENTTWGLIGFVCFSCAFLIFTDVYADEICGDGYTLVSTDNIAYFSMLHTHVGECSSEYETYNANYEILFPVALDLPTKCDSGYYYQNGNCVAYTTDSCEAGYVNETPAVQVSTFETTYDGLCFGGYDAILANHNSMYVSFSTNTKCGIGEYPTGSGCVAYATDNCPENYYAIAPVAAFKRGNTDPDAESECGTDYSPYYDTDYCRRYLGTNMDAVCTPQIVCTSGGTTLHTSTGVVLPIYSESITTPALHIQFENGGICYANMVHGESNGAIKVQYNDETYHIDY